MTKPLEENIVAVNVIIYEDSDKNEWIVWGHTHDSDPVFTSMDPVKAKATREFFKEEADELGFTATDRVRTIDFDKFDFRDDKVIEKEASLFDLIVGYDPNIRAMKLSATA